MKKSLKKIAEITTDFFKNKKVKENPFDDKTPMLSSEEIKQKLHLYNIVADSDLFLNTNILQQINFQYPNVFFPPNSTDLIKREMLIERFGPLNKDSLELLKTYKVKRYGY